MSRRSQRLEMVSIEYVWRVRWLRCFVRIWNRLLVLLEGRQDGEAWWRKCFRWAGSLTDDSDVSDWIIGRA